MRTEGQRLLQAYLEGKRQVDLARALGLSGPTVWAWYHGVNPPSLLSALELEHYTKGAAVQVCRCYGSRRVTRRDIGALRLD